MLGDLGDQLGFLPRESVALWTLGSTLAQRMGSLRMGLESRTMVRGVWLGKIRLLLAFHRDQTPS